MKLIFGFKRAICACFIIINTCALADQDSVLIAFEKNDLYGFCDINGKVIIPFKFDYAAPFSEELSFVVEGDNSYFIDSKGKVKINLDDDFYVSFYSSQGSFSNGFAIVTSRATGNSGYINKKGEAATTMEYDIACHFNKFGHAAVWKDKAWSVIDKTETVIMPSVLVKNLGNLSTSSRKLSDNYFQKYKTELFPKKKRVISLSKLQQAASYGDKNSICELGIIYYFGFAVEQSLAGAFKLFKNSATGDSYEGKLIDVGDPFACFMLALMFKTGDAGYKLPEKAQSWYKNVIDYGFDLGQGFVSNQTPLSFKLENLPVNFTAAEELARAGVEANPTIALYRLNLARILFAAAKSEDAIKALRQAEAFFPLNERIRNLLKDTERVMERGKLK